MEPASGQENQRECERGGGVDRADAVRIGVAEARAALIREEIANNFLWIATVSEAALAAVEFENDHDLGRAFDQMAKIFLCAAKTFEDLVEAQSIHE
jgi:hypothetical protein